MNLQHGDEMIPRIQVWSSGGGTQSAAIAALIYTGQIRPDLAVIVDTGYELSTTWDYHENVILPALRSVGVELHKISSSEWATVDLYSQKGDILIPAFTDHTGEIGKLPTYCSNEWKARPARRFASSIFQGPALFDVWLGISIDEMRRVRQPVGKWQNRYPLIEKRMSRGDCVAIVQRVGWPTPPRSSCWMCPNHPHEEWMAIKRETPGDWQKAIKFQHQIREKDDSLFLHPSGRLLEDVPNEDAQLDFFTARCDSGYCFS